MTMPITGAFLRLSRLSTLDGDWTSGTSAFPSGNGIAGTIAGLGPNADGVKAGERVVVDGAARLSDGSKVTVLPPAGQNAPAQPTPGQGQRQGGQRPRP